MKKTRILASVLALAMCFSAIPVVYAAYFPCNNECGNTVSVNDTLCTECQAALDNQQEATPGANEVDVSLTIGETWTVKIPKTIELAAGTKSAEYSVEVNGNIAGTKQVKVAPDADFLMSQDGKDDITATITQEKQAVASAEIESGSVVTLDGSISAPSATSGTWNGSFNFNIALEDAVELISFTLAYNESYPGYESAKDILGTYKAEKGMTWGEWVESDYSQGRFEVRSGMSDIMLVNNNGLQISQSNLTDEIVDGQTYNLRND